MSTDYRVALDMDSTLAATCVTAFDLLVGDEHDYDYTDIESWTWGFDEFGMDAYLSALWHVWSIRPDEVPTMEPGDPVPSVSPPTVPPLSDTVGEIAAMVSQLDIVTASPDHRGIEAGKRSWLDDHEIPYDEFVMVSGDKQDLDYDIYVDDNPGLPAKVDEARVFLRDHRYNRSAEGDYTRVNSVYDVLCRLRSEQTADPEYASALTGH